MSKVIITIEDSEDDRVEITTEFDPPGKPDDAATPAQAFALKMLQAASDFATEAAQ